MADKTKKPGTKANNQPASSSRVTWKFLLVIFFLILLAGGGFTVGVFLNLIDTKQLADDWKLSEKPIIGAFFAKPSANVPDDKSLQEISPNSTQSSNPMVQNIPQQATPAKAEPKIPVATAAEMEKLLKAQQQEEAKRISRLARLYSNMKPEEAVPILNELEDNTVLAIFSKMEEEQVAKLLAAFDPKKSARLTQAMLRGQLKN